MVIELSSESEGLFSLLVLERSTRVVAVAFGAVGDKPGFLGGVNAIPALAAVNSWSSMTRARWPRSVNADGTDMALASNASQNLLIEVKLGLSVGVEIRGIFARGI